LAARGGGLLPILPLPLQKEQGSTKERIPVLLGVVALMVVILAMSVAPALAAPKGYVCTLPDGSQLVYSFGQVKHARKTGEVSEFPSGTVCQPGLLP
jgi:hypothetical protein